MALHRLIISLAFIPGVLPAWAADVSGVYTRLDLDQCRQEARPPAEPDEPVDGATWWCVGYDGMPVRVAEGDLRFLISYGPNAAEELAAGQTLPQFNTINQTLEWRLDGSGRPFATILRYFIDIELGDRTGKGQVLVVTKLGGPGQICHVGYVDALATPNANAVAREIADRSPDFVCGQDTAGY